jgi:hypothetical protein
MSCETGCANAAAVVCSGGKLREVPCRGPSGCTSKQKGAGLAFECDSSAANAGEACMNRAEGYGACGASNDKEVLICKAGVWVVSQTCQTHCSISTDSVACAQ